MEFDHSEFTKGCGATSPDRSGYACTDHYNGVHVAYYDIGGAFGRGGADLFLMAWDGSGNTVPRIDREYSWAEMQSLIEAWTPPSDAEIEQARTGVAALVAELEQRTEDAHESR